jgi:hypothetical protein
MVGVIRSLVNEDGLMIREISGLARVDGPQVESWTDGALIPSIADEERIISIVKLAKREERVLL